jgi:Tol biopolymer transport system component
VWSPDGRWIAFLRTDRPPTESAMIGSAELHVVPPLGGPERQIARVRLRTMVGTPAFLAWCPDSTCLIVTDSPGEDRPDALFVVSLETGDRRPLTHPQHPLLGDCNAALAPDGRSLVFRRVLGAAAGELYWLHLGKDLSANGEPRRVTGGQLNGAFPAWMPDGNAIVFSARRHLWVVSLNGDGKPAQLPFVGEDGLMPVVSRPRQGQPARLIYVRSLDDANIWRLTPGAGRTSPPRQSWRSPRRNGTSLLTCRPTAGA